MRMHRPLLAALGAAALAGGLVSGCQDLDVTNPNNPDRDRAIRNPDAVESFIAQSFPVWWEWLHDDSPVWVTTTVADEFTSAFADFGQLETSSEPRQSWINSPVYGSADASEDPWYGLHSVVSIANDGLSAIDGGMVIGDETRTARTEAFAKFLQAIGRGYVALLYDQGFIIPQDLDVRQVPPDEAAQYLHPHEEVMAAAIAGMEEAIAIAAANPFEFEENDRWLFTAEMSNEEFVQVANSFLARFKAYAPRTRAERDAAPWDEIIAHVDAGIQTDFAPNGVPTSSSTTSSASSPASARRRVRAISAGPTTSSSAGPTRRGASRTGSPRRSGSAPPSSCARRTGASRVRKWRARRGSTSATTHRRSSRRAAAPTTGRSTISTASARATAGRRGLRSR